MRIIHTADIHLDSKMESHLSKNLAETRKTELVLAFNKLCEFAIENQIYAIIIAGDLFDIKAPRVKTIRAIEAIIKTNSDISFFYTPGNHDEFDFIGSLSSVPSNLIVFNNEWKTINLGDVTISGIVFNNDTKKYMYDTLNLDKDKKNIVVLHGNVSNYNDENSINLNLLKNKNIDYLALGHIHSYSEGILDDRGVYVYSGCLEGRGFDELGKKGFVLLNVLDDRIASTFIKNNIRQIHEVELDISNFNDFTTICNEAINVTRNIEENDIVLLTLIGEYDASLYKPIEILNDKLNSRFFFAKVKDNSILRINPLDYEGDLSLKGEFIRNVLSSSECMDVKKDIILCGIKAITGGDI